MNNHLDELIERACEKHSMPLADFIQTENLITYELGYEDILYADELNVAKIAHEEFMILLRERHDKNAHKNVVEYAIYSQEDRDGMPLLNSLNANAIYHLVKVDKHSYRNMASAIAKAVADIEDMIGG